MWLTVRGKHQFIFKIQFKQSTSTSITWIDRLKKTGVIIEIAVIRTSVSGLRKAALYTLLSPLGESYVKLKLVHMANHSAIWDTVRHEISCLI